MATELGGTQVASLMETLPGIATVLRSPVADALGNLVRAAARLREFQVADVDELMKYAVRRSLMTQDEADKLVAEVVAAQRKREERATERAHAKEVAAAAKPARAKAPVKPKAPAAKRPAAKPAVARATKPATRKKK